MKSFSARVAGLLLAFSSCFIAASAPVTKGDAATYQQSVAPMLAKYCYGCHNASLKSGNLDLQAYREASAALKDPNVWETVAQKLHAGVMPPPGLPRPKAEDVDAVNRWVQALLDQEDRRHGDPGRVTAHRLNRFEYNNT